MTVQSSDDVYIELAVDYPTAKDKTYTYKAPASVAEKLLPGATFLVEFNKRPAIGYFIGFTDKPDNLKVLAVKDLIESFAIPSELVEVAKSVARRYGSSIAEMLSLCSPPGESKKIKKTVALGDRSIPDDELSSEEIEALEAVAKAEKIMASDSTLKKLHAKGLIKTIHELDLKIPKENRKMAYCVNNHASPQGLTPKQLEIVSFIKAREYVAANEIKDLFSPNIVKRLQVNGVLDIVILDDVIEKTGNLIPDSKMLKLTEEQQTALGELGEGIKAGKGHFYLWGITGSGKTEIYKRAAIEAMRQGKTSLILVPEIALTPQLKKQFEQYFGDLLAILHSALPKQERLSNWMKIFTGKARVVLGTRLAVFSPLRDLGLIILDEEHESSYKQNNPPRYDARTVAVLRAKATGAVLVYGSATPSIENYHHIKEQSIKLLSLKNRINNASLPAVELIDMRDQTVKALFSERLTEAIRSNLAKDQKIMLFLNRRGFSRYLSCYDCSFLALCPNCSISLTYHKNNQVLCHYCNYQARAIDSCPKCGSRKIVFRGSGIQRIEEELNIHFPDARVCRMDSDSTSKKGSHESILRAFEKEPKSILLGTQMIAKGLHFPKVSLVGVVNADTVLNMPDFRAAEKTFQLLVQMSGRCGRGKDKGKVIVQTYNPDSYAIKFFAQNKFEQFYEHELDIRREALYPPFVRLINIVFSSSIPLAAKQAGIDLHENLKDMSNIRILGPAPSPIHKLNGKYRWHLLLKAGETELEGLVNHLHTMMLKLANKGVKIVVDVDPTWLL